MSQSDVKSWDTKFALRLGLELVNEGNPLNLEIGKCQTNSTLSSDVSSKAKFSARLVPLSQTIAYLLGIHEHFLNAPSFLLAVQSASETVMGCHVLLDVIVDMVIDGHLESSSFIALYVLSHLLEADSLVNFETNEIPSQESSTITGILGNEDSKPSCVQLRNWLGEVWLPKSGLLEFIANAKRILKSSLNEDDQGLVGEEQSHSTLVDLDAINRLSDVIKVRFGVNI